MPRFVRALLIAVSLFAIVSVVVQFTVTINGTDIADARYGLAAVCALAAAALFRGTSTSITIARGLLGVVGAFALVVTTFFAVIYAETAGHIPLYLYLALPPLVLTLAVTFVVVRLGKQDVAEWALERTFGPLDA